MYKINTRFLVPLAVADAYCLACEFVPEDESADLKKQLLKFERYISNPRYSSTPGKYTDDTEMSVANAQALIAGSLPLTKLDYANAYLAEFIRGGKRQAYATGFQKFLCSIQSGEEFLEKIRPDSEKNGAAMRAVPFGVIKDIDALLTEATTQASVTHNTHAGIFSSRVIALMSHYAFYSDDPFFDMLAEFCFENLPSEDVKKYGWIFMDRWPNKRVNNQGKFPIAVSTVHAVFDLLRYQNFFIDILKQTILWGGDTDSVAALAGGIYMINNFDEIPSFMIDNLELGNQKTGVKYLQTVSKELFNKYWNKQLI